MSTRRIAVKALLHTDTERKYHDIELSTAQTPQRVDSVAGGFFVLLNGIGRGNGPTVRIGDSIRMLTLSIRLRFSIAQGDFIAPTTMKYMLFFDLQTRSVNPTNAQLFTNSTTPASLLMSAANLDYNRKFKTLKRGTVTYDSTKLERFTNLFFRFRGRTSHVRYLDNDTIIASITANPLFIYFWSDQSADASPLISMYSRIRFVG